MAQNADYAWWLTVEFKDGATAELLLADAVVADYTTPDGADTDWDALYGDKIAETARLLAGGTLADVVNLYGSHRKVIGEITETAQPMWNVQCQVEYRTDDGHTGSKQVQTFQLNPLFVGDDKARVRDMAREIVNPCHDKHVTWVHVSAELV